MEKLIIIFCSLILLVWGADLNDTSTSTSTAEVIVESEPQHLVDISTIKNTTKDAADRIIKLLTSSKEQTIEPLTTEKPVEHTTDPFFSTFYSYNSRPFNVFGLHKAPERPTPIKTSTGERLCTCRTEYSIPSVSSSFIPSTEYNFNSQNIPTFEVVLPSKEYTFSNTVESPLTEREIINQYPSLDFKDLWRYQGSTGRRPIDKI